MLQRESSVDGGVMYTAPKHASAADADAEVAAFLRGLGISAGGQNGARRAVKARGVVGRGVSYEQKALRKNELLGNTAQSSGIRRMGGGGGGAGASSVRSAARQEASAAAAAVGFSQSAPDIGGAGSSLAPGASRRRRGMRSLGGAGGWSRRGGGAGGGGAGGAARRSRLSGGRPGTAEVDAAMSEASVIKDIKSGAMGGGRATWEQWNASWARPNGPPRMRRVQDEYGDPALMAPSTDVMQLYKSVLPKVKAIHHPITRGPCAVRARLHKGSLP